MRRRLIYIAVIVVMAGLVIWGVLGGQEWALIALAVLLGGFILGATSGTPSRQALSGGDPGRSAADEYAREQGWTDI